VQQLTEQLLLNALIEARSCERFQIAFNSYSRRGIEKVLLRTDGLRSRALCDNLLSWQELFKILI